jgi:hypothetical protein
MIHKAAFLAGAAAVKGLVAAGHFIGHALATNLDALGDAMTNGPVIIHPVPTGPGPKLTCGNCLGSLIFLLIIGAVAAGVILHIKYGWF